jgi:hypothetical protein
MFLPPPAATQDAAAVEGSGFVQYPPQKRFEDVKFQPLTHVQEPAPVVTERRPSNGVNSTNWKADKAVRSVNKSQQPRQHGRGGYPQANQNMRQQGMYGQQQGYPQQGYPQQQQGYYQQQQLQQQQGYYQQQQLQQQQGYYQQQPGYPQQQQQQQQQQGGARGGQQYGAQQQGYTSTTGNAYGQQQAYAQQAYTYGQPPQQLAQQQQPYQGYSQPPPQGGYQQGGQVPGRASNGGHAPAPIPRRADNPLGKHAPQQQMRAAPPAAGVGRGPSAPQAHPNVSSDGFETKLSKSQAKRLRKKMRDQ